MHILAGILGHGSLRTVQRYVHLTREAMARAVEEHREKEQAQRAYREHDERRLEVERRNQKIQ